MLKKICVIVSVIVGLLFLPKIVFADLASDYQSYLNATGTYNSAYNDYVTARANYLASGSLDSQDKAMTATLRMLQTRDNLLVSYLAAMMTRIQDAKGMSDGDKSSLRGQLASEILWYSAHYNKLSSAGSLNDLVNDSDQAKQQFNNLTIIAVYRALISLGAADNNYLRGQLNGQISALQAKVAEIKSNGDKDTSSIERSLIDVQNKISRSQDKDNIALNLINSVKPNSYNLSDTFRTSQQNLTDSQAYLNEVDQGLLQIIMQIKTN